MIDSSDEVDFFKRLFSRQQKEEQEVAEKIVIPCLERKEFPTPDDVREAINFRGGERRELLRHHAYWKEWRLRSGLESLMNAAHQAYVDICRNNAALGILAKGKDFEKYVDRTVGYAVQKDMMAYCSLVVGIRDTLRRIEKGRPDIKDDVRGVRAKCFDQDISIFINDMKNNMIHGSVMIPQWQISYEPQELQGSMNYPKKELLSFGKWANEAKRYVCSVKGDQINLPEAVGEHFELLKDLDRELQNLFAVNVTKAERDFFEIEDSHRRFQRRQWAKIMVTQIGKDKDPYEYLHLYFDTDTIREILCRPRHSKEQVDFIIALKVAEIDCDDELRLALYEKFGVPDNSST